LQGFFDSITIVLSTPCTFCFVFSTFHIRSFHIYSLVCRCRCNSSQPHPASGTSGIE
jgi:hypothetical protein